MKPNKTTYFLIAYFNLVLLFYLIITHSAKGDPLHPPTSSENPSKHYCKTQYPIILVHGAQGFTSLLGAYDYWYGMISALKNGGAEVYVAQLSSYHHHEIRGEQLIDVIKTVLALTGAEKVNLIGHSHGALACRYAAAIHPEQVASVTSVAGANGKVAIADYFLNNRFMENSLVRVILGGAADFVHLLSSNASPRNIQAALYDSSEEGMAAFNKYYPQGLPQEACGQGEPIVDGVYYFSWGGTHVLTSVFDFSDYFFLNISRVDPQPNDGIINQCSTHLGKVLKDDYPLNHLDFVNQVAGIIGQKSPSPVEIIREHAHRLKRLGL